MSLDGAPCTVCNAGVLTPKVGNAVGKFPNQVYYVCGNWQYHKNSGIKSPWILASDTPKIEQYLAAAAGEAVPAKRPAPAAAAGVIPFAKKPAVAKPAAAAVNLEHVAVTSAAKLAHIESRLEHLIGLIEKKNSNAAEEDITDEPEQQ